MVYVLIHEDRHIDVGVRVFTRLTDAVTALDLVVKNNRRDDTDYSDDAPDTLPSDWKYYVLYSCEGDSVRIVEREIE